MASRGVPHHGVQEADAAQELWPRLAELPEKQPADGLLLAQAAVVLLCKGRLGRATHRTEHTPWPRIRCAPSTAVTRCRAGTREPVLPVPGALPGSPKPFRSSSHWLTCGNRRISLHFLLLPFRLPPPPAARGRGRRGHAGRMGITAPARPAMGGMGWQSPCPVLQSRPVWGFPPSHHYWSPKPIAHTRTRTQPAPGLWATLKPHGKNTPSALERALTPEGTLALNNRGDPHPVTAPSPAPGQEWDPPWHCPVPGEAEHGGCRLPPRTMPRPHVALSRKHLVSLSPHRAARPAHRAAAARPLPPWGWGLSRDEEGAEGWPHSSSRSSWTRGRMLGM